MGFIDFIQSNFYDFITYTGFANAEVGNIIMIAAGIFFIWLAIKKRLRTIAACSNRPWHHPRKHSVQG